MVTLLLLGFGSWSMGPTETVSLTPIKEGSNVLSTWTTKVKVAELFAATKSLQAVTVPPLPTGGALLNQPSGAVHETNVVWAGKPSAKVTNLWSRSLVMVSW